jgi:hypothetical protein
MAMSSSAGGHSQRPKFMVLQSTAIMNKVIVMISLRCNQWSANNIIRQIQGCPRSALYEDRLKRVSAYARDDG